MELLEQFINTDNISSSIFSNIVYIEDKELPHMQSLLLTQPLLTLALTEYYQRTPKILSPLKVEDDIKNNCYARNIIMIVDKHTERDDALLADTKNESMVVALGFILINLSALPNHLIENIRTTQTPFGALLVKNKINTYNKNTRFFKLSCDEYLSSQLNCEQGEILYGRSNTLMRDDHLWIADVFEILTGRAS